MGERRALAARARLRRERFTRKRGICCGRCALENRAPLSARSTCAASANPAGTSSKWRSHAKGEVLLPLKTVWAPELSRRR